MLVIACIGIIPAYAGSTFSLLLVLGRGRDHPRIRGEHPSSFSCDVSIEGSSPHTRGALDAVGSELRGRGIIPAYAGST